ncbi:Zinc finger C2H2 [Penicillium chermesinum]|uniref:Zinc finger C2H2 n=1 Tax=Penicillium chermesinum TaxID=63820 RepID=A0A9W9NDV7_9EURO|nr:Zinc finger C2H2 [Penicillium chermesinum]KAJ5217028.1 Zinc finger C2H2 [Penicillium chermesinum]
MGSGPIPPHVRGDFSQGSPRASPTATSPSLSSFSSAPHARPAMTSHPYAPPQPLEPPATSEHRPNSVNGSPHMTSMGWASPLMAACPRPGLPTTSPTPTPALQLIPRLCLTTCTFRTRLSVDLEALNPVTTRQSRGWTTPGRRRCNASHAFNNLIHCLETF